MLINDLPDDVRLKALKNQKYGLWKCDKNTNDLRFAFSWVDSKEGIDYWTKWHLKNDKN